MKSPSDLKTKEARIAPPQPASATRPQSWLERLPAELLEQIFLHALEINMAKASLFLCRTLSRESIYRTLILFAFFEDDEKHPVETRHFSPAVYRTLSFKERLRLQQGIMDCRWCSLTRITQCLPTFERLAFAQNWHCQHERELQCAKVRTANQQGEDQAEQPSPKPPSLEEYVEVMIKYHNRLRYGTYVVPNDDCRQITADKIVPGIFSVSYLPNRLLNPKTWHDSNDSAHPNPTPVIYLASLLRASEYLGRQKVVDPAAVISGIETAIRERHRKALRLLLKINDQIFYHNLDPDRVEAPAAELGSVLPLATRQEGDSSWILNMLVNHRRGDTVLQRHEKVLTKWAMAKAQERDPFAKELLDTMAEGSR